MIFVASPYNHEDRDVMKKRIAINAKYCGYLLRLELVPVSPIMFGTKVLEFVNLPHDFGFWDKLSYAYLQQCNEMHVLHLDGWLESRGVKEEIQFAKEKKMLIRHIGVKVRNDDTIMYELLYEENN